MKKLVTDKDTLKIGERIRQERKAQGLTQKQLGEACGIAEPTIRRYELGKLNPKLTTLKKIASSLGTTPESLLMDASKEGPMKKVNVYLKSGQVITIVCQKCETGYSERTGKLVSYEFTGIKRNNPLYIDIADISAVVEEMGNDMEGCIECKHPYLNVQAGDDMEGCIECKHLYLNVQAGDDHDA